MTHDLEKSLQNAGSEAELVALLSQAGVGPGWAKPKPSVYPEPNRKFVPAHWRFSEAKAALGAAAKYVSTELAERRNLIMVNPHEGNEYATACTLVAAYQLVRGGEVARSHRHSPNAMRLVLEAAPNTYTIVDGNRVPMLPGDVLLTPNWNWHGHSNESEQDALWIDFLDVPFIHLIEPMFFDHYPERIEKAGAPTPDIPFRFPFSKMLPAVKDQPESRPGERWLEVAPPRMTTIGIYFRYLNSGAQLDDIKTTESRIYAVLQGSGEMTADGQTFRWSRGDVLVVPGWTRSTWKCSEEACLLTVTDRPMLKVLGLLRSEGEAPQENPGLIKA